MKPKTPGVLPDDLFELECIEDVYLSTKVLLTPQSSNMLG